MQEKKMEATTTVVTEVKSQSLKSKKLTGFEDFDRYQDVIDILHELRLKTWSEHLSLDFQDIKPSEQDLILKHTLKWAQAERADKKSTMIAAKLRAAKFEKIQTVDQYDFKHNKITESIEKNYISLLNSITPQSLPSAIFAGQAGLGKTHLARALGYSACQKGISVLFITAAKMVNHLNHAQKLFNLEAELNKYRRPSVLIVDELGYVTLDAQASNLFFQVVSARHDNGLGTIATTNLPFGKFNQIFANDAIAHAIVDRLVNAAEIFYMEGPSYREHQREIKQKRKDQ
jgi:DNA replication protein DnaC